jgi:ubiquinone/menaquinone biosynthesis C-methylase UbiE
MEPAERSYVPAAGHHWSLPLYDPVVKLIGGDRARRRLLEQADLRGGQRVLDIGCGTGSLVLLTKRRHPDVEVVGLDPDPKGLARAGHKAQRVGVSVQLDRGYSDELPYPEASFDHVFSSMMFHHLRGDEKAKTLREVKRVLKAGGTLQLLDLGGPGAGARSALMRWMHSSELLRDNTDERFLALMREAGLVAARAVGRGTMLFGLMVYTCYQAAAPAD